jgi:hypothetical protein
MEVGLQLEEEMIQFQEGVVYKREGTEISIGNR